MDKNATDDTPATVDFSWQFTGRIMVVDNGARLPFQNNFNGLMDLNALATIVFDPASRLQENDDLAELDEFQVFPHALLGDGQSATLHACMAAERSGTLAPLPSELLPESKRDDARVLAQVPVPTLQLDAIDGLGQVDWLLLDERNDSLAALEHGAAYLDDTLLVHARLPMMPSCQGQPGVAEVFQWMTGHGFQCYRLDQPTHYSHLPDDVPLQREQASQLDTIEAVFIPDESRLAAMAPERLRKLAFLLDAVHGVHDLAYRLLNRVDPDTATHYLATRGYLSQFDSEPDTFTLTADYSPAPWANRDTSFSRQPHAGGAHE